MVSCDCCGQNVIEIKCPFCVKDSTFDDIDDKTFYLKRGNDDQLKLDVKHQYYYQVQTQLGVCKIESAYFVVWTERKICISSKLCLMRYCETQFVRSRNIFLSLPFYQNLLVNFIHDCHSVINQYHYLVLQTMLNLTKTVLN